MRLFFLFFRYKSYFVCISDINRSSREIDRFSSFIDKDLFSCFFSIALSTIQTSKSSYIYSRVTCYCVHCFCDTCYYFGSSNRITFVELIAVFVASVIFATVLTSTNRITFTSIELKIKSHEVYLPYAYRVTA